jgi:murein DD-endopeptidase MepM/ murein hydrolase activator NlpD
MIGARFARPFARRSFFLLAVLLTAYCLLPTISHAQTSSELQVKIAQHNAQIAALNAEIAAYQAQLDTLSKQRSTLQSTIGGLTTTQKQLAAQISATQNKIASANLQLQQLSLSIGDTQDAIDNDQAAIARALRDVAEGESAPLVAQLFASQSLADAWTTAEQASQFNRALGNNVSNLADAKAALSANLSAVAKTKDQLVSFQTDLSTQQKSVIATKATQQTLLTQTKGQESTYQALLAQKIASEKAFESELTNLESQLNLIVHPGSLPKVGSGVLSWPFSLAFMQNCSTRTKVFGNTFCITQYFGNTAFSTANPQIYNGAGHNAIDIAAPIGTRVVAAGSGTVLGTGNTDLSHSATGAQCYSFGKWVMIKHPNGLNTMYAHLSSIEVSAGESVSVGQEIGLSGMTGYATGPHLHFGVYATEGTKIMNLGDFRGTSGPCSKATMPVATLDAYLNPLSYL